MMGYMHCPKEPAIVIYAMFQIKSYILEKKKNRPINYWVK